MNQGVTMLGFIGGGVLIYSAVTDNSIWDTITGKGKGGHGNVQGFVDPNAGTGSGGGGISTAASGTLAEVASAALKAYHQKQNYRYAEIRPIPSSLFGQPPVTTDCSGFSILCYKWAGLPDPSGNGYDGSGNTGSLISHMRRATTPTPGMLVFYGGTMGYPQHVAVYVGSGKVVSHGSPGDPSLDPVDLGISPVWGFYRPTNISNLGARPTYNPTGPGRMAS